MHRTLAICLGLLLGPHFLAAQDLYEIGEPTDEEQLFVELINRARADANAEAQRLANTTDPDVLNAINQFGVDLGLMVEQFATLTQVTQPLAINAALQQAAYLHSVDQFNSGLQSHTSSSAAVSPNVAGESVGDRVSNQGYQFRTVRENVFAYADSVYYGHAGFQIDWGDEGTVGGMQDPPGHRQAIHNPDIREIGVGIVYGTNQVSNFTPVGPMVVTQNFAEQLNGDPLITGVAFLDIDGDQFYDEGEGLGGIELRIPGNAFYAQTAGSGGYSLPVSNNGNFSVTISGPSIDTRNESVSITNLQNSKLDLIYEYSETRLSAPTSLSEGVSATFTSSSQYGATGYEMRVARGSGFSESLGAENGTTGVSHQLPENGELVQAAVAASGLSAYQLSNLAVVGGFVIGSSIEDAWLEIEGDLLIDAGATLTFDDRITTISDSQIPIVEISTDSGATWASILNRTQPLFPESSFTAQSVSLANYEGQIVQIRFFLDHQGGTVQFGSGSNTGWFVDNIRVNDAQFIQTVDSVTSSTTTFTFTPEITGAFIFRARALNGERAFPFGPVMSLQVGDGGIPDTLVTVFPDAELVAQDWAFVSWFGLFNTADAPWIYHSELGWLYAVKRSGDDGVLLYHPQLEWLWTTDEAFPYLYRLNQDRWLFLTRDNEERVWFYDFEADSGNRWFTFD